MLRLSEQKLAEPDLTSIVERVSKLEGKPQLEESWYQPTKGDIPLAIAGVGAGTMGAVVGYAQSKIAQLQSVKPQYLEILLGYLGYKYGDHKGHSYVSSYFGGWVIGGIGSLIEELTAGYVSGASGSSASGDLAAMVPA